MTEVVLDFRLGRKHLPLYLLSAIGEGCILMVVYVDDMVITWSNTSRISKLKSFLKTKSNVKDLGPLKHFLGIEVSRSRKGIFLSH